MFRPRRLTQFVSVTVIVGVVLGLLAAPASASMAQLVDVVLPPACKYVPPGGVCPPGSATVLVYQAESGEANRVGVASSPQELRMTDPAAAIRPGRGCTPIDRYRVNCPVPENGISGVFIDTGDAADIVRSRAASIVVNGGSITVNGGRGDDLVVGGPFGDELYAGEGADVLRGRGGHDRLYDASPRDPFASSDLAPYFPPPFEGLTFGPTLVPLASPGRGQDSFDGGRGRDTISYEGRQVGVTVDLANAAAVAGTRGEHDSVRSVERALGGAGDDRLAGNNRRINELDGTQGDDRIAGRQGTDFIEGGSGRNVIIAGPGEDYISSRYRPSDYGAERIFCGSGLDHVSWIIPIDFLNDNCEELEFNFLREGGLFGGDVRSLLPLRRGGGRAVLVADELWCYFLVNPSGCGLGLELLVHGPATRRGTAPPRGTLLGSASYRFSPDERKSVSLSVSPAGLRILRRHRALLVRVRVTEDAPHEPGGYLTVLRAP
jgi:RTX calcium-binding nonapeptide repeat (4 copies)